MSEIDRLKFDAVMQERDKARRECERLTRQELEPGWAAVAVSGGM